MPSYLCGVVLENGFVAEVLADTLGLGVEIALPDIPTIEPRFFEGSEIKVLLHKLFQYPVFV
ncbi:hypothetical protein LL912_00780 [Niabella sp. CC-SYL272]|uniref:hypothetical protein n=1 Tax=Niabella agricola TaxID=2891571 RepID=UPI001F3CE823|nr:hypothetical protein [Niabella agricola]MCF3107301.1 hypothetical protein [Niabella agricola]